jgi:hypothetical protein
VAETTGANPAASLKASEFAARDLIEM